MVGFVFHERSFAANPLIPLIIFKNRSCAVTFFCTTLHGLVLWCLLYYLPLYYEAVKELSPIQAGLAVLPETLTLVPVSIMTGLLITWRGSYRWAIWTGWLVTTVGMGLLPLLDVGTPTDMWIGLNLIVGLGTGLLFGAMAFAVQASVASEVLPVAVSMFSFFRSLGAVSLIQHISVHRFVADFVQAIGVAIGGTIFQNRLISQLEKYPQVAEGNGHVIHDGVAVIASIRTMPEAAGRTILVQAFANALQAVWVDMCIVSAVGLVASLLIQSYTLDVVLPDVEGGQK
jgi:hypothetical protein